MRIHSAQFIKGIVEADEILEDGTPQIAFIGRSNVGKSSTINSLTRQKDLARTSSFPGRTQEVNIFLINNSLYLVDLPGYGFAQASHEVRAELQNLITWYLFASGHEQKKIVLIIDAELGPTDTDLEFLQRLEKKEKDVVIVANKIDKIQKSAQKEHLRKMQELLGSHTIIPYSSKEKIGIGALTQVILE